MISNSWCKLFYLISLLICVEPKPMILRNPIDQNMTNGIKPGVNGNLIGQKRLENMDGNRLEAMLQSIPSNKALRCFIVNRGDPSRPGRPSTTQSHEDLLRSTPSRIEFLDRRQKSGVDTENGSIIARPTKADEDERIGESTQRPINPLFSSKESIADNSDIFKMKQDIQNLERTHTGSKVPKDQIIPRNNRFLLRTPLSSAEAMIPKYLDSFAKSSDSDMSPIGFKGRMAFPEYLDFIFNPEDHKIVATPPEKTDIRSDSSPKTSFPSKQDKQNVLDSDMSPIGFTGRMALPEYMDFIFNPQDHKIVSTPS